MRPEGCQETRSRRATAPISCNLHISNQFLASIALTMPKMETYTHLMTGTRIGFAVVVLLTVVLLRMPAPSAQAVQRSMYVSALNAQGAPVPDLGPSDFTVREENLSREILKVGPVETPLTVALMVDTSQASRPNIRDIREAAIAFIKEVTSTPVKHQVAL